jgi:hypothetical protein
MVLTKHSFALCAGILFFFALACQADLEKSPALDDKLKQKETAIAPGNGHELINLLMEKAEVRASLSEADKPIVRNIFEEAYTTKFGDLMAPLHPDSVPIVRKAIFFGSRDSLKKYMKVERKAE